MKRVIFIVIALVFTFSTTMVFASNSDLISETEKKAVTVKTETKLTDAEIERITKRVEEIREMDKSDLTASEKNELKSELKEMKKEVKKGGGTIYIGGATLLLIIILLILLV